MAQLMNQFAITPVLGEIDLPYSDGTISAIINPAYASTALVAGQAVKLVTGTTGTCPIVTPCTANTDSVFGFINYNAKNVGFVAGNSVEISQSGNVMYLASTAAITQGAQVQLDISAIGGVVTKTGSSGAAIVGWAFDGAAASGALIRVKLSGVPVFVFA